MSITRTGTHLHNPLHIAAVCATAVLALVMLVDPLFPPAPAPLTQADGGHEATDVIGQLTGSDTSTFDFNGANNSPNSRGFSISKSVAVDEVNHRLFVGDLGNNRILVFELDASNELIDRRADAVLGQPNFRTNDYTADEFHAGQPYGIVYSPSEERLYTTDFLSNRVLVWDVSTVDDGEAAIAVLGQPDFTSSGDGLSDTEISGPHGLALDDDANRLFLADQSNNRVMVWDFGVTPLANGIPATYVLGAPDFDDDTGDVTQNELSATTGLAFDSDSSRLFVVDAPSNRVMVFDVSVIVNGENAINVLGQDDFTSSGTGLAADQFDWSISFNLGAAVDPDDQRLFVGDSANHRVLVFDVDPAVLVPDDPGSDGPDAINVLGQTDFTTADDLFDQTSVRSPSGMSFASGFLYVAGYSDFDTALIDRRVMVFDVNAITDGENAVNLLGQLDENDAPVYTVNGIDNSPNHQGWESNAGGVALDTVHNRIFIADFQNHRILVFNRNADGSMPDYHADFVLGQPDFKSLASDTTDSTLSHPTRVAYDGCTVPLCPGTRDLLFVADSGNARVLVYDTTTITNGEAAIGVLGQTDFVSGGGGTSVSELNSPQSVSAEPLNGFLAVGDVGNNRVLIYNTDTSTGLPLDGDADRVFGQPDFDTNNAGTSENEMNNPVGVLAETNSDSLWVADQFNNRVLRFDLFGASSAPATHVLGQSDFTGDGDATTQSGMDDPIDVSILGSDGSDRRLFVSEVNNNRVLVFDISDSTGFVTNGEDAFDVYGQDVYDTNGCNLGRGGLCNPNSSDYDEANDILYVADAGNARLMLFGVIPADDDTPPPTGVEFAPRSIQVNQDETVTDSRNVLVTVWATNDERFTGTVDVLLSNDPSFSTFVPFRYNIPGPGGEQDIWPKTIAWDLCFGQSENNPCDPGNKTVYARFYVNVPLPSPALTP